MKFNHKQSISTVAALSLMATLAFLARPCSAATTTVCHRGLTTTINSALLQLHLAHGDTLGSCPIAATCKSRGPVIATQPQSQPLSCGSNSTFGVVAQGPLPISYQWLLNGMPIAGATASQLIVSNVSSADLGAYQVIVSNAGGSVTSAAAVLSAPDLNPQMTIARITRDGVMAVCWPQTCVKYELQESTDGITYSFTQTRPGVSEGSNCVIVRISSKQFRLIPTSFRPPRIVEQPASRAVPVGSTETLRVVADGTPPLQYQWRLNGENLEGQTNQTLVLADLRLKDFGAYEVAVANACDATNSQLAILAPTEFERLLFDTFDLRFHETRPNGTVVGDNFFAGKEPGEPNHAGIAGGRSVWFGWTAPAQGVVTFTTMGSSFDTVLAAYTGSSVGGLTQQASDDDSGGFKTSLISFTVFHGLEYQVAVDGFAAQPGVVVLSWEFTPTTGVFPRITSQPSDQILSVSNGVAFFGVGAELPGQEVGGPTFQWRFNGVNLPGQTNQFLAVSNVQPAAVGDYTVAVNNGPYSVESQPASLQIVTGPVGATAQFVRKLEVDFTPPVSTPQLLPLAPVSAPISPATTPVAGSIIGNNYSATRVISQPISCRQVGWIPLFVTNLVAPTGTHFLTLNTSNSLDQSNAPLDTIMAVYTNVFRFPPQCNNDAEGYTPWSYIAPFGVFPVTAGYSYKIYVDTPNAVRGRIQLNYRFE